MHYLNITFDYNNKPLLDRQFIPFGVWEKAYLAQAEIPFATAIPAKQIGREEIGGNKV